MSEAPETGGGDQVFSGERGDRQTDGGNMGGRSCEVDSGDAQDGSTTDDQSTRAVGRPSDYGEIKKTHTIRLTDRHWSLWGKAAHPENRTRWLEKHLDEHADKIEAYENDHTDKSMP